MCILFRSHLVGIPGLHVHQARGPFIQVNASVERKWERYRAAGERVHQTSLSPPELWLLTARPISRSDPQSASERETHDAVCRDRPPQPAARHRPLCHSDDILPHCCWWWSCCCCSFLRECRGIMIARWGGRGEKEGKKEKKEAENTWRCPDYSQLIPQQAIGWERLSVTVGQKQSRAPSAPGLLWWEQRQEEGGGVAVRGGDGWGWEQSITGREGGKKKDKSRFTSSYQCLQQDEPIFKVISVGICVKNVLLKKI